MDGVDPIIALSLDGGGFLALSELYILKEILERLQYELNLKTVPLPCEVFDVIGGSGSGGIIALLLGRLRLDVDTAIRLFIQLYRSIYSGRLHTKGRRSKLFGAAFQILLTSVPGFGITDSLFETDPKCNTFVCASPTNVQNGKPTCFRNFVARKFRTFNCSIFEAARACTAHPQLFLPVKIGHPGALESFSDASAYGYSNPIQVVNEETESLFKDRKRVYLSLGSGVAHASPWGMGSRLVNTSGNGDVTTEDFMPHAPPGTFVRFSVEQGFHSHERHTFTDPGNILTQTTSYLKCAATEGHMPDIILPLVQRQISKLPPPDLRVKNSQDTLYHILSSGSPTPSPSGKVVQLPPTPSREDESPGLLSPKPYAPSGASEPGEHGSDHRLDRTTNVQDNPQSNETQLSVVADPTLHTSSPSLSSIGKTGFIHTQTPNNIIKSNVPTSTPKGSSVRPGQQPDVVSNSLGFFFRIRTWIARRFWK